MFYTRFIFTVEKKTLIWLLLFFLFSSCAQKHFQLCETSPRFIILRAHLIYLFCNSLLKNVFWILNHAVCVFHVQSLKFLFPSYCGSWVFSARLKTTCDESNYTLIENSVEFKLFKNHRLFMVLINLWIFPPLESSSWD